MRGLNAIRAGWWAFRNVRNAQHVVPLEMRQTKQQQRIREMSDEELLQCARQWGGHVVRPEMRRRGIDLPGGPTSA